MNPVSPLQAAIAALITDLGTAAVSFGVFNNITAATLVTAVVGLVSVAFIAVNELRHHTAVKYPVKLVP